MPPRATRLLLPLLLALGASGWGVPARAASFDCARATTTVERTICGDAELSRMDEALDQAYRAALASPQAGAARDGQRAWLAGRNRCTTAACVRDAYAARLAQLSPGAAKPPVPAAAPSCRQERGAAAAAVLVKQCIQISPATHPPCHEANPCALILDEIARGCGMAAAPVPAYCRSLPR